MFPSKNCATVFVERTLPVKQIIYLPRKWDVTCVEGNFRGSEKTGMAEEFSLVHQLDGPVLIIRTKGYLNDLGAEQVDTVCTEHLENSVSKIVINLEQSPLINSIGISILIGVIEAIEDSEGALAFTNLTPTNRKTFEMMGLLQFAQAFDSEAEAVSLFKAS